MKIYALIKLIFFHIPWLSYPAGITFIKGSIIGPQVWKCLHCISRSSIQGLQCSNISSSDRIKLNRLFTKSLSVWQSWFKGIIKQYFITCSYFLMMLNNSLYRLSTHANDQMFKTWARSLHRSWSCSSRTLGGDMLAARCLMLNSYLIDRYFSVHLTTYIGDVKLVTNVVYGRNGLCL